MALWRTVRQILEAVWGHQDYYDAVEERLEQFAAVDPGSHSFRYPVDRKGQLSLPNLKSYNVRRLRQIVEGMATVLDGASAGLYEYAQAKSDMWREYYLSGAAGDQ
jgi:hypothetical protein